VNKKKTHTQVCSVAVLEVEWWLEIILPLSMEAVLIQITRQQTDLRGLETNSLSPPFQALDLASIMTKATILQQGM